MERTTMNDQAKTIQVTEGAEIRQHAARVAALLANVPGFVTELVANADRKAETSISPLRLERLMNKHFPKAERDTWPVPGSEYRVELPDGRVVLNNNHDLYDTTDDDGKKAQGSFYGDILKGLPPGQEVVTKLAAIKAALKNAEGADPTLVSKGDKALESMKAVQQRRFTNLKRNFIDAVELITAIDEANDMLDGVEVSVLTEADGVTPTKLQEPIVIADISDTPNARLRTKFASPSSFKALSPGKVTEDTKKQHGGEWQAFVNSGSRKPKGSGAGGKDATKNVAHITNTKQLENYVSEITAYLDNATEDGRKHIAGVLRLLANKATGNDLKVLFGNLCMATDEIWLIIGDDYTKIMGDKAKTAKEAAKARADEVKAEQKAAA